MLSQGISSLPTFGVACLCQLSYSYNILSFFLFRLFDFGYASFRMKSLEQDALKAQMVIAKSRDSKKRGTLDQLTESPSPAPTPSPTPLEGETRLLLVPSTVACMIQR